MEAVKRGSSLMFALLVRESTEEEGGHAWKRMDMGHNRWKNGRTQLVYISSCLYHQLVS